MKIEIDLNNILGDDDYGSETLQESIRRQVIENLTSKMQKGVMATVDQEVRKQIGEAIQKYIADNMGTIMEQVFNQPYKSVDRYGTSGPETTFRQEIVKALHENMKYVKKSYDSEKNVYSKLIDDYVGQQVRTFQTEYFRQIDAQFLSECHDYAIKKLRERLKLS